MPSMLCARNRPGCFKTKEYLYVLEGKTNSTEKFSFKENSWELLNIQIPESLYMKSAFTSLPYGGEVIFLGGYENLKVHSFDIEQNSFKCILNLSEYDRVYNQPIIY